MSILTVLNLGNKKSAKYFDVDITYILGTNSIFYSVPGNQKDVGQNYDF